MNRNTQRLASLTIGLSLLSGSALLLAAPPSDEKIAAAIEKFQTESRELERGDVEGRIALAEATFGSLDFSTMTLDQLQDLRRFVSTLSPEQLRQAHGRIDEIARDSGEKGFSAALLRTSYHAPQRQPDMEPDEMRRAIQEANQRRSAAVIELLRHPWLQEAMKTDRAGEVFSLVGRLSGDDLAAVRDDLLALEDSITSDLPRIAFARLIGYYQAVISDEAGIDASDRERIRQRMVDVADEVLAAVNREQSTVERTREYLAGAFARGELVDHKAPEMEFIWSSAGESWNSLADLRGNVVVIDFWATWCGPCVASFPEVRELTAHYEGYPVVVLGVTSLQGRHIARKAGESGMDRIDTSDDPDKELALMKDFMSDMDMTWPVVFSKESVFNPDFGVRGIPHVAILDPEGKVRYRGLHPAAPRGRALQDKAEKIDGLLREFNLPTPPAPAEPETDEPEAAAAVGE